MGQSHQLRHGLTNQDLTSNSIDPTELATATLTGGALGWGGGKLVGKIGGTFRGGKATPDEPVSASAKQNPTTTPNAADPASIADSAAPTGNPGAAKATSDEPAGAGGDDSPQAVRTTENSGSSCTHSFAGSTPVLMADGSTKPIKDVHLGDTVASTDPTTGKTQAEPVVELHDNHDTDLADVTVKASDGSTTVLHTTWHHPFWDAGNKRWVDAAALTPGTQLHTIDGGTEQVQSVKTWTGLQEMHDLTLAAIHTYYVIAGGTPVLVHNCGSEFAPGQDDIHYRKHVLGVMKDGSSKPGGADMPEFLDKNDYVQGARDLLDGPTADGVLEGTRGTDTLRFDRNTGAFGVKTQGGTIRTFFRPDGDGEAYFRGIKGLVPTNF